MESNIIYRKESIVYTTIDVIDELGIQSVSTREVARRQGISQSTIFKYFPKKNDLLMAVLDYFSKYDKDIFQTTQIKKFNPREAIIYYLDSYVTYYENYPAITAIAQSYDSLLCEPELSEKVKNIFTNRFVSMKKLIEDAQAADIISKSANSDILTDIITSTIRGLCLKWRMYKYSFSLREQAMKAANMILNAFSPNLKAEF